jgi:hypothetical protein
MMPRCPVRLKPFVPVLLVALCFFSSSAFAQLKPDFSGTWKPAAPATQINIVQDGPAFAVTIAGAHGRTETLTYQLDGVERRNTTKDVAGAVWTHVSQATWMNSAVVITTTTIRADGGQWQWMRVYSLKGDGQLSVTTFDGVLHDARLMDTSTVSYEKVSQR